MANSPTMCQLYVARALNPIRIHYPDLKILHYMDDVLSGNNDKLLDSAYVDVVKALERWGLYIAPEKVQHTDITHYLGNVIHHNEIKPQKITLHLDKLTTLNDFQKLLGDINWLRP